MSRLLHLSDTHFGTERAPVQAALERFAHACGADAIVVSGDITQRATAAQFAAARRFLERLPALPTLVLPGNHDIPLFALWQRLFSPYRRYRRGLGLQELSPTLSVGALQLIGVRSTRRRRHIDGELSARQVREVAARLRAAPASALKVVVTHQPLLVDRERDLHNVCHGAQPALAAWAEAGADLLLAGHIHWPFARALPQRHTAWAVNAGTAVSHRTRPGAPNSVNLIDYHDDAEGRHCRLRRYDCGPEGSEFSCVAERLLPLQPR
jgi:3',5'-cyclic AMP phosphodiesterase CpdA